jgi:hypothetical protein
MSRQILEITLRLPDGHVLTGRGRNLLVTMERIYNQAISPAPRCHVLLVEHLKAGYEKRGEHRYQGPFHARFAKRGGDRASPEGVVVAVVTVAQVPGPK